MNHIGNKLIEVKNALPHGQFGDWAKLEFPHWTDRTTSQKYMKIAKELNADRSPHFPNSMKALYALASGLANADDSTKEEILEKVETKTEEKGKALTEKEIKELINLLKLLFGGFNIFLFSLLECFGYFLF